VFRLEAGYSLNNNNKQQKVNHEPRRHLFATATTTMRRNFHLLLAAAFVVAKGTSALSPSSTSPSKSLGLSGVGAALQKPGFVLSAFPADAILTDDIESPESKSTIEATSSKTYDTIRKVVENTVVQSAASVFAGTVLTFILHNFVFLEPIKASSLTALLATLVLPAKFAPAVLCGSFAGMANLKVIPGIGHGLALGLVCAVMMAFFDKQKWLVGTGGRLGFISQCACTLQFIVSCMFLLPPSEVGLVGLYPKNSELLAKLPSVAFFTAVGAFFMSFWKEAFGEKAKNPLNTETATRLCKRLSNSVAAVGGAGLLASLLLPASAAGPVFCGTFIAMSAPETIQTYGGLLGASIMGAVCQQSLTGVLVGGWGGKLGTASLMGVISYNKLMQLAGMKAKPVLSAPVTEPVLQPVPSAQ
jgi:hypothetical protein